MRKRIGEFLVEKGVIPESQVEAILKHGAREGLRFGDAALDLGIVSQDQMVSIFGPSYAIDFFHLDSQYFPATTRDALPLDFVLKHGVLPLGMKTERKLFRLRKQLNLGFLDPARADAKAIAAEALRLASSRLGTESAALSGTTAFLVLPDQFIEVLAGAYGAGEEDLAARDPVLLDPLLSMFLGKKG